MTYDLHGLSYQRQPTHTLFVEEGSASRSMESYHPCDEGYSEDPLTMQTSRNETRITAETDLTAWLRNKPVEERARMYFLLSHAFCFNFG